MATRFNGFGELETVEVKDAPMASMFGLGPRSLRARETSTVVRLSRARGRKRRRR